MDALKAGASGSYLLQLLLTSHFSPIAFMLSNGSKLIVS